jgi:hypothetical protein
MSDVTIAEEMKDLIDADEVHASFKMNAGETAYYACRPSVFAFLAKYVLCFIVLGIHLLFWWVNVGGGLGDDVSGGVRFAVGLVDFLGIGGFVFVMLILTWINRFMNWSSSGRWYTTSLMLVTFTPLLFVIEDVVVTVSGWFGSSYGGVLPTWDDGWYLVLGVGFSAILLTLTIWYSRSFKYAISDREIYLKKDFMLNKNIHSIDLIDIDNLKLDVPWYGRILRFGTINMLTGSGFGIKHESISVSAGGIADAAAVVGDDVGFIRKVIRGFLFMVTLQRTRDEMNTSEPEDCLFGVRKATKIYHLIRELRQARRSPNAKAGEGVIEPERMPHEVAAAAAPAAVPEPVPVEEETESEPEVDDLFDDLDADMDLN